MPCNYFVSFVSCRMKKWFLLFTLAFVSQLEAQTAGSYIFDGEERSFVYYVPSSWDGAQEYPLLIVLHGLTQSGNGIMNITGFNEIADVNNAIVCYPDGLNASWNADMNSLNSEVDDLGFIESLVSYFETNYNTNPYRRYLCGFSNGGYLSHKIASESSMCFAAIGTVAGNMSTTTASNFNPSFPTSVLHIHGTADAIVPYNGGAATGASVDEIMSLWQSYLSCDATPELIEMPNPNLLDFSFPESYVYQNCEGSALEHIKVNGGGHQWPGIATLFGGLGTINMDFYSPQVIWDFLENKSCPDELGISDLSSPNNKLLKITDCLGRETSFRTGVVQWYLYTDGSVEKRWVAP